MSPFAALAELEPVAGRLLERHLATTKEWFPHELVPYSRGRDFEPGEQWREDDSFMPLDDAVRSALFVNLLTEDNLPYYFRDIDGLFGRDGSWGDWARRWTAEEGRHSIVIRDYLTVSRAIDPVALERGRMVQVSNGRGAGADQPVQRLGVPHAPGAGDAHLAPQHRQDRRGSRRVRGHGTRRCG